jgi:ribosomal-protein-alanine N-acetyltransferase
MSALSVGVLQMNTQNLELVPHTPQHLRALIEGPELYEKSFGVRPAEGLKDFFVSAEVSPVYLAELQAATIPDPWTHGFALVHAASRTVIGMCGFKGPPGADGVVEIAYGIVPAYRGKGFATEAAQALMSYAFASGRVRVVRAHTLPELNASTTVLAKCGFKRVGEVVDPEDGLVWRWEKYEEAA